MNVRVSSDGSAELKLDKTTVVDYMEKFDLLTMKLKKLDPILSFKCPLFKVTQDLCLQTQDIPSPFGATMSAERVIGKLQPYLYNDDRKNIGLGLVAINTASATLIGKFKTVPRSRLGDYVSQLQ